MSLVKLNRKDWVDKKSLKRLKIILKKCRNNYSKLDKISNALKSYNISTKDIDIIRDIWILKAAKIDNIIQRK